MDMRSKEIELNSINEKTPDVSIDEERSSFMNIIIDDTESDNYNSDDNEDICVICLENFDAGEPMYFHCGHIFHIHCILDWIVSLFQKNADISCPICRSIECYSNSPHYRVLKRVVGFNHHSHMMIINDDEIQRRTDNNQEVIYTNQRVYQDNQQSYEGTNRMFLTFIKFLCILLIGFLIFLIYSLGRN